MNEKTFNFNLGNRRLTADESRAVEIAKRVFHESLVRHGKGDGVAARAVFMVKSNAAATGTVTRARGTNPLGDDAAQKPQGTQAGGKGTASWPTNKVAPAIRKY
ncbi:hypothetical protein [Rugamonas sp. DEMB1]|uniref:hypothetical protein n=1 Tax=Rugamonas sp. DEMB1 TaxID=3039386 RepID=UPI002449B9F7|nr:hypothetical protein [Rugamonas sp. DEMB1]WGG48802.1 hypothetical protein QC826_19405 [Rugamonas sp. DEMB1]